MFKLDHIAISVVSASETIKFYQALDFVVTASYESEDKSLRIFTLKDKDGGILELLNYTESFPAPEHTHTVNTDLPVIGVKQFGLCVDSITNALKTLQEKGFAGETTINKGRLGRDWFFIKDPNGILLEIIETNS